MRPTRTRRILSIALALIALACAWFYLAPTGLGGSDTYVVTEGVSMQPRFHSGDLVLVRRQSSYHVGEIVAYHSDVFHTTILHRIIAREGGRYVFKGDNNDFVDFEHPAAGQLIGALWLHLPGTGRVLASVRSPALVGGLLALGTLLLAGGVFVRRRGRRRRHRRAENAEGAPSRRAPPRPSEPALLALALAVLALLPFVALALLAFTRAPSATIPVQVPYHEGGSFTYSAPAAPGPIYPANRAETGEPLFTRVLDDVSLAFAYRFHSSTPHALTGTASLAAEVSSTSGWQTTLPLARPTPFRGDRALVTANLSLPSLLALVHRVQATTAVAGSYTLTLLPRVLASGTLAGVPLSTTFTPPLQFSLNQFELQPVTPAGGPLTTPTPASPLTPSTSASVTGGRDEPRSISLLLAKIPVARARTISLAAIAAILLALILALALIRARAAAPTSIPSRYRHAIVPVDRVWQLPGVPVIDLADIDALARIAEHYDRAILHERGPDGEAFWVSDESGQFRYAATPSAASPTALTLAPQVPAEAEAPVASVTQTFPEDPGDRDSDEASQAPIRAVADAASDAFPATAVEPLPEVVPGRALTCRSSRPHRGGLRRRRTKPPRLLRASRRRRRSSRFRKANSRETPSSRRSMRTSSASAGWSGRDSRPRIRSPAWAERP